VKALIFDLDGTLVDSVYAHVMAFQIAFAEAGMPVEAWRIHRHVGMSGDLLTKAMARDSGHSASPKALRRIEQRHGQLVRKLLAKPCPLPGARELLKALRRNRIPHGIATSGKPEEMKLATRGLALDRAIILVNRSDAERAKPEPDLFIACQKRLGVRPQECYAVGDATWDLLAARRAGMLGIALLTGGYSREELLDAGAYRVFENPRDLHRHLEELGLEPRDKQK
jgi:HAD superfamily hydrolase (TIGR01549 family)